jgi:hypothetical protein
MPRAFCLSMIVTRMNLFIVRLSSARQRYPPHDCIYYTEVQQLTASGAVCGFSSFFWSTKKLLDRVHWLSIRLLIFFHTVLRSHKNIKTGFPRVLNESIYTTHPIRTSSVTMGLIRFWETFRVSLTWSNSASDTEQYSHTIWCQHMSEQETLPQSRTSSGNGSTRMYQ